jgi:PadR family transcriptional regulator, regulatory protein PadR
MKTREYLILLALAETDLHGLAIARAVIELSEGQTRLWPVSLYGTLESLETTGLIEELDDPRHRPADESEKKRFYRLTRTGHRALATETERLAAIVKIARSRLKPRPGAPTTVALAKVVK